MIPVIIVEDDLSAQEDLLSCLKVHCPELEILNVCNNIMDAYKSINLHKPKLVFLDINLGNRLSFELLELFDSIFFKIIFITAYDHYALKAIKFSAIDYVLKPYHESDVVKAVERAKNTVFIEEQVQLLQEQIGRTEKINRIAISSGRDVFLSNITDIIYCKSDGNFSWVYTKIKKIYSSHSLKELEDLLTEHGFFRIHKSFLINLKEVSSYSFKEGGDVMMSNDEKVPISELKKGAFLQAVQSK